MDKIEVGESQVSKASPTHLADHLFRASHLVAHRVGAVQTLSSASRTVSGVNGMGDKPSPFCNQRLCAIMSCECSLETEGKT
jgi:hypothetical protein